MNKREFVSLALTVISIGGLVATAISAIKHTPDAIDIIEKEPEDAKPFAVVKDVAPCYFLTACICFGTIGTIVANAAFNRTTQKMLGTSVSALSAALISARNSDIAKRDYMSSYVTEVANKYGEEEEAEIHKKAVMSCGITPEEQAFDHREYLETSLVNGEQDLTLTCEYLPITVQTTLRCLEKAEYMTNKKFCMTGEASMGDLCVFLGMSREQIETVDRYFRAKTKSEWGVEVDLFNFGWSIEDWWQWIEFVNDVDSKKGTVALKYINQPCDGILNETYDEESVPIPAGYITESCLDYYFEKTDKKGE